MTAEDVAVAAGLSPATLRNLRATQDENSTAQKLPAALGTIDDVSRKPPLPWAGPGGELGGFEDPMAVLTAALESDMERSRGAYALRVIAVEP